MTPLNALKTTTVLAFGVVAFAGCKPIDAQQSERSGTVNGDLVITTSMTRSGGTETHYAECGPDPTADTGDYQVVIPVELDYGGLPEGAPCPAGPRELVPSDAHPELYAEMSDALHAPAPYRGGDETCSWEASTPEDAQLMAESCAEER